MKRWLSFRRRLAFLICPEIRVERVQGAQDGRDPGINGALLSLCAAFQAETALSDWEVASRAGVNNRAIKLIRDGAQVSAKTAARLFEFFEEAWPSGVAWPLEDRATTQFGTILTIPVIEMLGGPDAMLSVILASGRKRTRDAVLCWARRAGMPEYARFLAGIECQRRGIAVTPSDFEPARLTPAQIDRLRHPDIPRPPQSKKEAA